MTDSWFMRIRRSRRIAEPDAVRPAPGLVEEAARHPGEWVYEIEGDYGPAEPVPPHAIRGAWKVDDGGQIVGDFVPNPNFQSGTNAAH